MKEKEQKRQQFNFEISEEIQIKMRNARIKEGVNWGHILRKTVEEQLEKLNTQKEKAAI